MKKKISLRTTILLLGIVLICAGIFFYFSETEASLTAEEKLYGLSQVWKRTSEMFGYWELLPDLDWDAVYQTFIPRVLAAKTVDEYYGELQQFIAHLEDEHSWVGLPDGRNYYLPIALSYVERNYMVIGVNSRETKIPLGSIVTTINGIDVRTYLTEHVKPYTGLRTNYAMEDMLGRMFCAGTSKKTFSIGYITPDGEEAKARVSRSLSSPGYDLSCTIGVDYDGKSHSLFSTFTAYELTGGIFLLKIPHFQDLNLMKDFDRFLSQKGDKINGFIIDLRGNGGGNGMIGYELLSRFTELNGISLKTSAQHHDVRKMSLASIYDYYYTFFESGIELDENMEDNIMDGRAMLGGRYYADLSGDESGDDENSDIELSVSDKLTQPAVVLCDFNTGSAAEDTVYLAKESGRFTVMGTNTRGTTGQLAVFDLPGGGVFSFSCYRVMTQGGEDFINQGILPDIWAELSMQDYLGGTDSTVEKALAYLLNLNNP